MIRINKANMEVINMFYPNKKFIKTLSEGERFTYLKIICGMIAMDKQVSQSELAYLKEIASKYAVTAESLATMIKTANHAVLVKQARTIDNRIVALMLIKDLCMVANNDVELCDEEIDYILDIAEAMNIEADRVRDINTAVNKYLALSEQLSELLESEY